jgi:hypothetical protein
MTHPERVLYNERSDRPVPQHLNKSLVGIKADEVAARACAAPLAMARSETKTPRSSG